LKGFLQRILQEITKKEIKLGTSDAWSMRRSSHRPSNSAYYIEDSRISIYFLELGKERVATIWSSC
jgi:hypothetical protein